MWRAFPVIIFIYVFYSNLRFTLGWYFLCSSKLDIMFPIANTWKEILLRGYLYGMGLYVLSCGGGRCKLWIYLWRPKDNNGCHSLGPVHHFVCLLCFLSLKLAPGMYLSPHPKCWITAAYYHAWIFFFFKYRLWVLNSCPQAFKASTSPSELSL